MLVCDALRKAHFSIKINNMKINFSSRVTSLGPAPQQYLSDLDNLHVQIVRMMEVIEREEIQPADVSHKREMEAKLKVCINLICI